MSWTINSITNMPANEAAEALKKLIVPESILEYVATGIEALADKHGKHVLVTVIGYGHLATRNTLETSTATVNVRRGER